MFSCGTPLASRSVSVPLSCDGKPVLAAGSDIGVTVSGIAPGFAIDRQRPAAAEPHRSRPSWGASLEPVIHWTLDAEGDSPESSIEAASADGGSPVTAALPTEYGNGEGEVFQSLREPRDTGLMGLVVSGRGIS